MLCAYRRAPLPTCLSSSLSTRARTSGDNRSKSPGSGFQLPGRCYGTHRALSYCGYLELLHVPTSHPPDAIHIRSSKQVFSRPSNVGFARTCRFLASGGQLILQSD